MNNQILYIAIAIICAYLIGSFPSAYIICRLRKGVDIREIGSRNMGAMNVFYKVGFAEGLMVLALDIGKGVLIFLMPWGIPVYLAIFLISLLLTRYPTLSYSLAFLCFPFLAWLKYHSVALIIFSAGVLLFPLIKYIPRIKEMHAKAGSWRQVFLRRNLKDRL